MRRSLIAPAAKLKDGFDPKFYRENNPDLAKLSSRALRRHYRRFGRLEGRPGTLAEFLSPGRSENEVPAGFDPRTYLQLNPDLVAAGVTVATARRHYVLSGADERREIHAFNADVYRELYFGDEAISDNSLERHFKEIGRDEGRIGSAAELLAADGVYGAAWADLINLQEFALLNWSWARHVSSYIQAVRLMAREGIARIAPLSLKLEFDPAYFREVHPEWLQDADEHLYRRWLFEERARTPGTAAQHLAGLALALRAFPTGFLWREYARGGLARNRWEALDHLVKVGAPAGVVPPVQGAEGGEFLAALSQTLAARDDLAAVRLLEVAREHPAFTPSARQWLGDCLYRLGRWREAYDHYLMVARSEEAVVWSFVNGARAAIRFDRPDLAVHLLEASRAEYSGEQPWRAAVGETIQAEFDRSWMEAEALYLLGERARADAVMETAIGRTRELWSTLDPLGTPLPPHPDGRVVVLANVDLAQCTHYRVNQKADLFEALERPYAIYPQDRVDEFITALPGAAAAIFYRTPAMPALVRAIDTARNLGVPTFYDIDDLIFDPAVYPEPRETYAKSVDDRFYAMLQLGTPLFRAAMALCDHGIASTTALARHMAGVLRSGTVHVLPNGLDHTNEAFLDQPPIRTRRDGEFVIFYGSGTKAHNSDFVDLAGPALNAAMRQHRHVRLMIVGHLELDATFDDLRDRINYMDWVPNVEDYWSILAEADLNIAVLADHPTTHAKSEIKWIEAAALGLPSIVSATDRYKEVLTDGEDALIASSVEDWTDAFERMITDAPLRARLVSSARRKLRDEYALRRTALKLDALLPAVPKAISREANGRRRILLVNLFFPPQTYGGSTRVTRDNLDFFLSQPNTGLDFAVLTSDFHADTPYRQRVEEYRGVPVFRISTPGGLNMEWRPRDAGLGAMFADILDLWSPDLVHVHCAQRLTASIVEECRKRSVPYVTTLHDAWWVSDYQFLSDGKDRLRTPGEAWPLEPPPPITVGESLARRRYLQPLLHDSAEILGVSESFTRLHRECGFERAICVANGVPPMPRASRTRSRNGRVRLAQIGSQTYFKGYHHIEAALKQGRFSNLELTVVDHRRYGGAVETTRWGATPVHFVGKTKQERMHEFYAGIDVLLAPSLWPESFGLVTREALNAGLWVLASDRGAIGEDVTPGRNGWIVDVSDLGGVMEALAQIDADPARYLDSPPAPEPPLRSSDDQARDLLRIYHDVLARPRPASKSPPPQPQREKAKWSLEARRNKINPYRTIR